MMGNFLSIITKYAKTMVNSIYHKVENFKALFQNFLKQLQHSFGRKSATKPDIDPQWEISGSLSDNNSSDHEVTIDFHDHRIVPLPPSKTRYLTFHGVKTGCDGIPEAMALAAAGFYYNGQYNSMH